MEYIAIGRHDFVPVADKGLVHLLDVVERAIAVSDDILVKEMRVRGEVDILPRKAVDDGCRRGPVLLSILGSSHIVCGKGTYNSQDASKIFSASLADIMQDGAVRLVLQTSNFE